MKAWNYFFQDCPGAQLHFTEKRQVENYMLYWRALMNWKDECGFQSVRPIEKALYDYGRSLGKSVTPKRIIKINITKIALQVKTSLLRSYDLGSGDNYSDWTTFVRSVAGSETSLRPSEDIEMYVRANIEPRLKNLTDEQKRILTREALFNLDKIEQFHLDEQYSDEIENGEVINPELMEELIFQLLYEKADSAYIMIRD